MVLKAREPCPIAVLKFPVVLVERAFCPIAVLLYPVILATREEDPIAVFSFPVVLEVSEEAHIAVFQLPLVLVERAFCPIAVLNLTLALERRAFCHTAVFPTAKVELIEESALLHIAVLEILLTLFPLPTVIPSIMASPQSTKRIAPLAHAEESNLIFSIPFVFMTRS